VLHDLLLALAVLIDLANRVTLLRHHCLLGLAILARSPYLFLQLLIQILGRHLLTGLLRGLAFACSGHFSSPFLALLNKSVKGREILILDRRQQRKSLTVDELGPTHAAHLRMVDHGIEQFQQFNLGLGQ